MSQKIAFGIGMLANQMFPAALGIFMVILVQSLGMSPILWGLIFFLPKLIDAITDPLMGYISDRTESRWGKRRPYVFIGAIIAGLSYIAMWQLSEENTRLQFKCERLTHQYETLDYSCDQMKTLLTKEQLESLNRL